MDSRASSSNARSLATPRSNAPRAEFPTADIDAMLAEIESGYIGAAHPHKVDAQRLLERQVSDRERLVTDAEVLQEILHRYVAIDFDGVPGITRLR
jgi:hypothetical protein